MNKKVAVALSGGVDSAVSALLLKERGYNVVGITFRMFDSVKADTIIQNATKVANSLDIPIEILDLSQDFQHYIINYFEKSYYDGQTPNPCIMCNKYIKWGSLFDFAIKNLQADYLATGHYANIKFSDGFYKLYPAVDSEKDQLYFLFSLNQEHLSKTLFPLSEYTKEYVRELAIKYNLPPKSAKESQDICFIEAPMTTKKYLNNLFKPQKGDFIEFSTGRILGHHDGFWQYTIGQRKGIGIAAPQALYVVKTDAKNNTVYLGYENELYTSEILINNFEWSYPYKDDIFEAFVKIRYNMPYVKVKVNVTNKTTLNIHFENPVSSVTKGQACVLYDINDKHLLGGGWI